jgi:hypothetical protein
MAIITSAPCTLFSCGTCGEQVLVAHSPENNFGRNPTISDQMAQAWWEKHLLCPPRVLALPKTIPPDRGSEVVA